jgi:hypothetical protein
MKESDKGDGWKVQETIDPKTGESHRRYLYKNKKAPRALITSKLAQQLAGYTLIEKDLRNILIWLDEIDTIFPQSERPNVVSLSPDRERFNIIKGLYVAALTFYGKCFATCEGRKIKLDRKFVDDAYKEAHDHTINMRNNFAAHSGADSFEEVKVALVLYPNKRTNRNPILYKELMQPDAFLTDPEDEIGFKEVTEHLQGKVLDKMSQLTNKIMTEEVGPKGKEHWYRLAKKANK